MLLRLLGHTTAGPSVSASSSESFGVWKTRTLLGSDSINIGRLEVEQIGGLPLACILGLDLELCEGSGLWGDLLFFLVIFFLHVSIKNHLCCCSFLLIVHIPHIEIC